MTIDGSYGPSAPERGWVPAPSYLLRRHRVIRNISSLPLGKLLEIGCGAGALLTDLSTLGFECSAVETSPAAVTLARYVNRYNPDVRIYDHLLDEWRNQFDYVLALEVLEHIEDDRQALKQWAGCLKPGGVLLISVPAHTAKWNASDKWAGHFRRYDRPALRRLLEDEGFFILHWECYGFPLTSIIEPLRAAQHARSLRKRANREGPYDWQQEASEQSGIDRSVESRLYPLQASWAGRTLLRFFAWFQGLFLHTDLGNGYLVLARKEKERMDSLL